MPKIEIVCNHCCEGTSWYESMLHELGYVKVDAKIYCEECLKKLGHVAMDL